jgi:hypothetical protein
MSVNRPNLFSYLSNANQSQIMVIGTGTNYGSFTGETIDNTCPNNQPALYFSSVNNTTKYIEFSRNWIPTGTIEFWFKTNAWSLNNTTISDGVNHGLMTGKYTTQGNADFRGFIDIRITPSEGIMIDTYSPSRQLLQITNQNILASTWYHFAYAWDKNQSITQRAFLNGISIGTTANVISDYSVIRTTSPGARTDAATGGLDGWMSGFKIYNYMKIDFSDRFKIRAGMKDIILI